MNPLIRAALMTYKIVLKTGFLNTSIGRSLFNRSYMLYKQTIEARHTDSLMKLIKPGSYVIDVGANIGFFTRKFANHVCHGGKVIAIEPEAHNFAELRHLIKSQQLEKTVAAYQVAASDKKGELFLKIDPYHPANHKLSSEGVPVAITTIDALWEEHSNPPVSLIKIDVQGAEKQVLVGALQIIKRCHPAIYSEVDDSLSDFNSSLEDVFGFLASLGYAPYQLTRSGISSELTVEQAAQIQRSSGYSDFLFLHSQ